MVFDTRPTSPDTTQDRRKHHDLREKFDQACRLTESFFDRKSTWSDSPHILSAHLTLKEAFPELTAQELSLLFAAVQRRHRATTGN